MWKRVNMSYEKILDLMKRLQIETDDKPKGTRLWGKCPYHDDHEPSWFVRINPERYGQHFCFSCKNGGTLFTLVKDKLGLSSKEVFDFLRGMEPEATVPSHILFTPEIHLVSRFQADRRIGFSELDVIHGDMDDWIGPAKKYIMERRVTRNQVNVWGLGYCVEGRLEGRIFLPVVRPGSFEVACYQARSFTRHENRYLYPTSSEKPDFDVMFGEARWCRANIDRGGCKIIVTEGAFNALAIERALLNSRNRHSIYLAALGGSIVRPAHLAKLATFGAIDVATDDDDAGNEVSHTIVSSLKRYCEHAGKRLRRVKVSGCDIDEADPQVLRDAFGDA